MFFIYRCERFDYCAAANALPIEYYITNKKMWNKTSITNKKTLNNYEPNNPK